MRGDKTDANQKGIVGDLRGLGIDVYVSSGIGGGFPDIVVAYAGRNWFIEIKTETGKLTKDQKKFISKWSQGQYSICRSTEGVLETIGAERKVKEKAEGARKTC